MASTTPQQRQYTRQNYLAATERESGLMHLWHMGKLAEIRLGNQEHLVDTVAIAEEGRVRHAFDTDCRARRLRTQERTLCEKNQLVLRHLIAAADDGERRARGMYLGPDSHASKGTAAAAVRTAAGIQTTARLRARQRRAREVDQQNQQLLRHLNEVPPGVPSTAKLHEWYHTVHRRRLKQLQRFRPAEPFAGASILQKECGVRLRGGRRSVSQKRRQRYISARQGDRDPGITAAAKDADYERYARRPLIAGQPYPSPDMGETLACLRLPRSLLPALQSTSYGGYTLGSNAADANASGNGADNTNSTQHSASRTPSPPLQQQRRRRPEWQNIAVTDIPLMHYAADQAEARDCRWVQPSEEGPCTRLWRGKVRDHTAAAEERRVLETVACNPQHRASLKPQEQAILAAVEARKAGRQTSPLHSATAATASTSVSATLVQNDDSEEKMEMMGSALTQLNGARLYPSPAVSTSTFNAATKASQADGTELQGSSMGRGAELTVPATHLDKQSSLVPHPPLPAAAVASANVVEAAVANSVRATWTHASRTGSRFLAF